MVLTAANGVGEDLDNVVDASVRKLDHEGDSHFCAS